jgi:hypothetical protein
MVKKKKKKSSNLRFGLRPLKSLGRPEGMHSQPSMSRFCSSLWRTSVAEETSLIATTNRSKKHDDITKLETGNIQQNNGIKNISSPSA